MTLIVSEEEWTQAEAFFKENPSEIKFKPSLDAHSFIQFSNGKIVALARRKNPFEGILGEGFFSTVKQGISRDGQIFAVKILGGKAEFETHFQFAGWEKLKELISYVWRNLSNNKVRASKRKLYLLTEYIDWQPLSAYLISKTKPFPASELNLLIIALECCISLHVLQKNRVIHQDINSSNILISNEEPIRVRFIDFDFSILLPETAQSVSLPKTMINKSIAAPEVLQHHTLSFSSDVYSLGKVLENMNLSELASLITSYSSDQRASLLNFMYVILEGIYLLKTPLSSDQKENVNRAISLIRTISPHIFRHHADYETLWQYWDKSPPLSTISNQVLKRENKQGGYVELKVPYEEHQLSQTAFVPAYEKENFIADFQKLKLYSPTLESQNRNCRLTN